MEQKLESLNGAIDGLKAGFIERLAAAVAIPSVSAEPESRPKVVEMAHFLEKNLKAVGATDIVLHDVGMETPELPLPPVVTGRFGSDPAKRTLLVYGHYDVQPAAIDDGWDSEPFTLETRGDAMFGRGSTDDKGPLLDWINVLEAHAKAGLEVPVNLVFCFEGMEESGSVGLEELIERLKDSTFAGVDAVCISDNYWLGTRKPGLTYGLRGVSYYEITVSGPKADLHSGLFGGVVHEPMTDLVRIMATLVDPQGNILIPGVNEMVKPLTPEEDKFYDGLDITNQDIAENIGADVLIHKDVRASLQHRWRFPSLSLHGVEGAFATVGAKTVIPAAVKGKFSIRTVPDMDPRKLDSYVYAHVKAEFAKLGSKNSCSAELLHDGPYWVSDPNSWSMRAAIKATKSVWGVDPELTREGGSIPITISFQDILKTSVVLIPVGRADDGAHSTNEKLNVSNYIEGAKTLGAYLHYLAVENKD